MSSLSSYRTVLIYSQGAYDSGVRLANVEEDAEVTALIESARILLDKPERESWVVWAGSRLMPIAARALAQRIEKAQVEKAIEEARLRQEEEHAELERREQARRDADAQEVREYEERQAVLDAKKAQLEKQFRAGQIDIERYANELHALEDRTGSSKDGSGVPEDTGASSEEDEVAEITAQVVAGQKRKRLGDEESRGSESTKSKVSISFRSPHVVTLMSSTVRSMCELQDPDRLYLRTRRDKLQEVRAR
jgi:hypothetical protein